MTIGLEGFGKQKEDNQLTPFGVYHFINYIERY